MSAERRRRWPNALAAGIASISLSSDIGLRTKPVENPKECKSFIGNYLQPENKPHPEITPVINNVNLKGKVVEIRRIRAQDMIIFNVTGDSARELKKINPTTTAWRYLIGFDDQIDFTNGFRQQINNHVGSELGVSIPIIEGGLEGLNIPPILSPDASTELQDQQRAYINKMLLQGVSGDIYLSATSASSVEFNESPGLIVFDRTTTSSANTRQR